MVARRVVEDNPVVIGSTVALVPGYYSEHPLFSPYVCRENGELVVKSLATEEYNYPEQEWFIKPLELGEGYWSEPYIDEGGGDVLMSTYSVPLKDYRGQMAAVLTADVSLEWLSHLVNDMQVYDNAYGVILSRQGKVMIGPKNENANGNGNGNNNDEVQKYTTQVERTGWMMSIVIPEKEIFGAIRRISLLVNLLQLLGIGMIVLILRIVTKNQLKYQKVKEKEAAIESELHVANAIQTGMLPHTFPTYPDRDDVQLFASLTPAKDVGGDLFDFYIRDEKLFFCIGDVSGKGVPASLFMSVTRSIFRTVSARESTPDRIVATMNETIADMNETNMFVTLFVGVLDLKPFDRLNRRIAAINQAEIYPVSMMPFLPVLESFGIETLGDVQHFIDDNSDDAHQLALSRLAVTDLDILSSSAALQYLCLVYVLKHNGGREGLKAVYDTINGESESNGILADMILEQAETLPFMNNKQ